MKTERVLVIIVTYNAMQWANHCISSLYCSEYPVDIFIIDNGSTDGTQKHITEHFPNAIFIRSEKNLGFGAANNLGIKYALDNNYDYVYLLNQDAWIFPDTIGKLINVHKSHNEYGILSPIQLAGNEHDWDTGFKSNVSKYVDPKKECFEVSSVMAAHWFIPVAALKQIGGFSPAFFHYGEDMNFIDRALFFGYRVGVAQDAKAVHDRSNRILTKEKEFYLKNVAILIRLSNPQNNFLKNVFSVFYFALGMTINSRSFKPIVGYFKHMANVKNIYKLWQASKLPHAFI